MAIKISDSRDNSSIYTRYWVYSAEEANKLLRVMKTSSSSKSKLGTVIKNGSPRQYTSIVTDPSMIKYSDSVIVMTGDIRTVKFTLPDL